MKSERWCYFRLSFSIPIDSNNRIHVWVANLRLPPFPLAEWSRLLWVEWRLGDGGVAGTRKIDTWAPNGPTKTGPTGTGRQKHMHIMNGWTRRRRNGCQKYIASLHPLPARIHVAWHGSETRTAWLSLSKEKESFRTVMEERVEGRP